jgi:dUTP pyrophosphatase
MKVKFKKTHPEAHTPTRAHEDDAGLDLYAAKSNFVPYKPYVEYDTGIAVEIPSGHVGLLFSRSSVSNMSLCNSVGVIDENFRGSIKLRFYLHNGHKIYEQGNRIGQLIIMPYPKIELEEVNELTETNRGKGEFGSSGS